MKTSSPSRQERETNPFVVAFELGGIFNRLAFHLESYRLFGRQGDCREALQACGELKNQAREVVDVRQLFEIRKYISSCEEFCESLVRGETLEDLDCWDRAIVWFVARYEDGDEGVIGEVLWYLERAVSWIDSLHTMFRDVLPKPLVAAFLLGETVDQGLRPRVTPARLRESARKEYRREILGSIPRNPGDLPPDPDWWGSVCTQWSDLEELGELDKTYFTEIYSDVSDRRRAALEGHCADTKRLSNDNFSISSTMTLPL
jgi:hypothetical protein